jgi:DNA polymerase III sliding clamp (beta) subunit (PCNA family)
MTIKVNKTQLVAGLQLLENAVSQRGGINILDKVKLTIKNNTLVLSNASYNMSIYYNVDILDNPDNIINNIEYTASYSALSSAIESDTNR